MKSLNCTPYEIYNSSIISSDNCYVIDEKGNNYVDFESGVWCTALGHNNKNINNAIYNQLNKLGHVGYRYTNNILEEACESLLEVMNFQDGKCLFLSSGSEAVEFTVQAVKNIMDKPYFLCLCNHYLSAYGISNMRNSENWICIELSKYYGESDFSVNGPILKDIPFDKIGAFIFEPGNASGTVKLPPSELISSIVSKVKENSGYVVVDEVTTGLGRTGKWFGFQHYDIKPDIVACGKGLGNGYPVSAIVMTNETAEKLKGCNFKYAQSHQNDPLGCAVVKEVIKTIKDQNLIERSKEMGKYLKNSLLKIKDSHKSISEIRGTGLMIAMEFHKDGVPLADIHRRLFNEGHIVGLNISGNLLRFYPPLTIEKHMIDDMINSINIILSKK